MVSTHPRSIFRTGLLLARPARGRRYTLFGTDFKTHHRDGSTEKRRLRSVSELRKLLGSVFLVTPPNASELDAILARLIDQSDRVA